MILNKSFIKEKEPKSLDKDLKKKKRQKPQNRKITNTSNELKAPRKTWTIYRNGQGNTPENNQGQAR